MSTVYASSHKDYIHGLHGIYPIYCGSYTVHEILYTVSAIGIYRGELVCHPRYIYNMFPTVYHPRYINIRVPTVYTIVAHGVYLFTSTVYNIPPRYILTRANLVPCRYTVGKCIYRVCKLYTVQVSIGEHTPWVQYTVGNDIPWVIYLG